MADSQKLVLPLEYQEVEYIENTSTTQYIDTGWKRDFNKDIEIEAVIKPSTINKRYCIISDYSSQNQYNMSFEVTGDNFGRVFINAANNLVGTRPYNSNEFNIFKFSYDHTTPSGTLEVNSGSDSKTYQTEVRRIAVDNARIFVDKDSRFNVFNHSFKLKKMRIKEDNVLVRNFIPCYRKSDNEAGLYDTVNDVFYTNQGTGSFTVGANISSWQHSLRKLTTATEAVENPLYSDGTAITSYTIKGNTVQNGTPTPSNPVDVNGVGVRTENLVDDPSTYVNGYINSSGNLVGQSATNLEKTSLFIPIPSGTTELTLSSKDTFPSGANGIWIAIACYSSNTLNSFLGRRTSAEQTLTYEIPEGTKYVRVSLRTYGDTVYCMLNTGSTPLLYEPYGIKIPISSGGVTTNIYLGSTSSTRQIKKLVLDGTEDWSNQYGASLFSTRIIPLALLNFRSAYCNAYKYNPVQSRINDNTQHGDFALQAYINQTTLALKNTNYSDATSFKNYLADQYANGTPVVVWYVLATPETAAVNEPLMKIGDHADTVSNATAIPTTEGANSITVDTTVQPSEFTATWTGWHNATVKEWNSSQWNE